MFKLYYFISMLCIPALLFGRVIEKSLSVHVIKEKVNGIEFAHRTDITNGKRQEVWAINGQSVTYDAYLDAILEAEKEERRLERKKEFARQKQEDDFKIAAQKNAITKLIMNKVDEIAKELQRIENPLLSHYLQFDGTTFSSEKDLAKIVEMIEYAKNCIQPEALHDYDSLKLCLESLEKYPERLHRFYQDSVTYAVNTCNDTRMLKDLLVLLS